MYVEKGIRGSISYAAERYSKSNDKYMKTYDDSKPSKHITYLDANNLFGWATSQYLPYGGCKWLNQEEIDKCDLNLINGNSSHRYIL